MLLLPEFLCWLYMKTAEVLSKTYDPFRLEDDLDLLVVAAAEEECKQKAVSLSVLWMCSELKKSACISCWCWAFNDGDDMDLFDGDTEEEKKAAEEREAAKKAFGKKKER